jgi:hypothetical protein
MSMNNDVVESMSLPLSLKFQTVESSLPEAHGALRLREVTIKKDAPTCPSNRAPARARWAAGLVGNRRDNRTSTVSRPSLFASGSFYDSSFRPPRLSYQ